MIPESVYIAVSFAKVKIWDKRKEKTNKQNKLPRQSKTEKKKKILRSGANEISGVVARVFPEGKGSSVPQGKINDFPLGGVKKDGWPRYIQAPKIPQLLPQDSPCASHSRLSLSNSSLCHPPFIRAQDGKLQTYNLYFAL